MASAMEAVKVERLREKCRKIDRQIDDMIGQLFNQCNYTEQMKIVDYLGVLEKAVHDKKLMWMLNQIKISERKIQGEWYKLRDFGVCEFENYPRRILGDYQHEIKKLKEYFNDRQRFLSLLKGGAIDARTRSQFQNLEDAINKLASLARDREIDMANQIRMNNLMKSHLMAPIDMENQILMKILMKSQLMAETIVDYPSVNPQQISFGGFPPYIPLEGSSMSDMTTQGVHGQPSVGTQQTSTPYFAPPSFSIPSLPNGFYDHEISYYNA